MNRRSATRVAPLPSPTSGPSSPAIQKIVIVLQENHTFDNYFGTYPNAEGTAGRSICLPQTLGSPKCVAPFHAPSRTPVEMNHNWASAHADFDAGKMDGFVYSEGNSGTMGYYDRTDLPHYWTIADRYVLLDRYFTSVMSESAPNHLYLVAGTADGLQNDAVPATLNFPPIFEQLDQAGVSWKVYGFTSWYRRFAYVQNTPSAAQRFGAATEFGKELASGALPTVSWVVGAPGGDEHPPKDVGVGQNSVANDIVNALGASPDWPSVAVFVTWDDYGGFYDHVPPPQVDAFGYGFRVPCLIVSPYARSGFIDHSVNDHTSILRFVERRFGLSPLSTRDAAANDLSEAFDFMQAPRPFLPV